MSDNANTPERPTCCGECRRYLRDLFEKGVGGCDNWAGVRTPPDVVCHPNFGIKQKEIKEGSPQ